MIELLNYIKADIYKTLNRKYMYVFLGVMLLLALTFNVALRVYQFRFSSVYEVMDISLGLLIAPMFLVIMMVDVVIADQIVQHTYKNVVAFGASRVKLYLANVITSIIIAIVLAIIILAVFLGSAVLLLQPGDGLTAGFVCDYFLRIGAAMLVYIACIAIGSLLAIVLKNNTVFAFTYAGCFLFISGIIKLLATYVSDKFSVLSKILLTTQVYNLIGKTVSGYQLLSAVFAGIIYTIIFIIIGVIVFKRQEIK